MPNPDPNPRCTGCHTEDRAAFSPRSPLRCRDCRRGYYVRTIEARRAAARKYHHDHRDALLPVMRQRARRWKRRNRDRFNAYQRAYRRRRLLTDPKYRERLAANRRASYHRCRARRVSGA